MMKSSSTTTPSSPPNHPTTTTKRFTQTALLLRSLHSENLTGAMNDHGVRAGAAMKRRQRRLRSMLRHERQSIAMALAERLHHSAKVTDLKHKEEVEQHFAPRGPKTARAEVEEAVNAAHDAVRGQNTPPPGGAAGHPCGARVRNVEQIAVSRVGGGLQDFRPGQSSSSSSHVPTRVPEAPDEPGEGFFSHFFPK